MDEHYFWHFREAENLLRRIGDDVRSLRIVAEYARNRPPVGHLTSHDLDFLTDRPSVDDSDQPIRNVLELSKRYEWIVNDKFFK